MIVGDVLPLASGHKMDDVIALPDVFMAHIIKLTVTKGSANGGCFFGISSVTLSGSGSTKNLVVCGV